MRAGTEAEKKAAYERRRQISLDNEREKGRLGRNIEVRQPRDRKLRVALERSIYRWLQHYFPEIFFNDFTRQQKEMIQAILHAARYGGDQAIAAPRGEGKTVITECVTIWCLLKGILKFALICASTRDAADVILRNIKTQLETNKELVDQYPEVCDPIVALDGSSRRAGGQLVDGKHTRITWKTDYVVLPTVPRKYKSRCCGSIIMTRSMDGAIRGLRVGGLRPDLAIIDDPETRESAESDSQIERRIRIIEQDIGGLGGQRKRLARLILCTTMNRRCIAYQYTDPASKPSWRGKRLKALITKPKREDMWAEYVELRQSAMAEAAISGKSIDNAIKLASEFYAKHRRVMDDGAVVANPMRYDSHLELSGLHRIYNIIADYGEESFLTEHQNDPPEHGGLKESGIHPVVVSSRLSGLDRCVVPPGTGMITGGIDLGKTTCHWSVIAWQSQARGSVIDYGVEEVWPENRDNQQAVELALLQALYRIRETMQTTEYIDTDGQRHDVQCVLVDSGNWDRPVYEFVRATGEKVFRASKGFGDSAGGRRSFFRSPDKQSHTKRVGEHCFASLQQTERIWLIGLDSDYWKAWLHERFMTPAGEAGSMTLYGNDKRRHIAFSHHICAEVEVEEFVPDKGLKRYWKKVSQNNHWLDTTYMACVAASLHGMKLIPTVHAERQPAPRARQKRRQQPPRRLLHREGGWIQGMQ